MWCSNCCCLRVVLVSWNFFGLPGYVIGFSLQDQESLIQHPKNFKCPTLCKSSLLWNRVSWPMFVLSIVNFVHFLLFPNPQFSVTLSRSYWRASVRVLGASYIVDYFSVYLILIWSSKRVLKIVFSIYVKIVGESIHSLHKPRSANMCWLVCNSYESCYCSASINVLCWTGNIFLKSMKLIYTGSLISPHIAAWCLDYFHSFYTFCFV